MTGLTILGSKNDFKTVINLVVAKYVGIDLSLKEVGGANILDKSPLGKVSIYV